MSTPVIGAIVDFSPGISVLVNPLTLNDPYYGQLDFGQIADSAAYYVNITSIIKSVSIRRGRSRTISQFEAGNAVVELYDNTGNWNPENPAGAYYPDLIPLRKIQIYADYNGTRYYLFTGFISNYITNFSQGVDEISKVTLRCVDAFSILNGALITTVTGASAGQLSGTRVNKILDQVSYPSGLRDIEAGDITLQADPGTSRNSLDAIRTVEQSELGGFFIDAEGRATFLSTETIAESLNNVAYTFSDTGVGIAFQQSTINYDADILLNDVTITRAGGSAQNKKNQSSIDTYFTHSGERKDLLMETDAVALDAAGIILATRSDVELRIDSIQLSLDNAADTARIVAGLNLELLDAVSVTKAMPGSSTASQTLLVQGLQHDLSNARMITTVITGESLVTGFILNSATLGIINTDVLGY